MPVNQRSSPSEDDMPNVLKVLDLIVESIKAKKKNQPLRDIYTQIAADAFQPKHARSIAKECLDLTNKCLSSHRYREAARLLWVLCQDLSVFDMFIYRASMIVLENLEMNQVEKTIYKLLTHVQQLHLVNKKEVQLEYVNYALTHRYGTMKDDVKELIEGRRQNCLKRNPVLDPIYMAYLAYLESVDLCEYESGNMSSSQVQSNAQVTIEKLKALTNNPGNWDIFVLKMVELYEKYSEPDEVDNLLLKYVEKNPDSLNARIYLCLHLNQIDPDSDDLIQHLKVLQNMSPSDERVLILLEKLKESDEELGTCLKYTFMFLDYPTNGKNHCAWKLLWNFLDCAESSGDKEAFKAIKSCWTSRQKIWHWLHFNPSQEFQLSEMRLAECKVNVLSYLDKDHAYIKKVYEKFPTIQESKQRDAAQQRYQLS